MSYLPLLSDTQYSFLRDIGPVMKCWPNSINVLSKNAGISKTRLRGYLEEKNGLEDSEFIDLVGYMDCPHNDVEYSDGSFGVSFDIINSCTLFPNKRKDVINSYDCLSGGGDIEGACEIISEQGLISPYYRFILINRYGNYFLICTKIEFDLSKLIRNDKLINFSGACIACNELIDDLNAHIFNIIEDPFNCKTYDEEYYRYKYLTFSQLFLNIESIADVSWDV